MSTNKTLSIVAVVLLLLGSAFPFYSSSFYEWSRERHNATIAEQLKIQCPDYPNSDSNLGGEIADECGRMLYDYIDFEYVAVAFGSVLAVTVGLILGIVVIVRKMRTRPH